MPGGRPRTSTPPPDECEALGKEMLEWVVENKPTHLSEWFSIHKMITWKVWDAMCQVKEFLPYYEVALSLVAKNIRDGAIDKSLGQRFMSLYHRDLKREEREKVEHEHSLKAGQQSIDPATIANTLAILDQVTKAQEARKAADNNSKTECKS